MTVKDKPYQLLLPFNPNASYEIRNPNEKLAPREWILDNSLDPYTAKYADPLEVYKMMREGVKPREIIILSLGR